MPLTAQDRELLRSSLRRSLASLWPVERVHTLLADASALRTVWSSLASQGIAALGADPDHGGMREAMLVQEELGRACCPAPLTAAVLANVVLADQAKPLGSFLAELHAGQAIWAFGLSAGDPGEGVVQFENGTVAGKRAFVEGAQTATHVLLSVARGVALAPLGADVAIIPTPGYSVPSLAEVEFREVPATYIELSQSRHNDLVSLARLLLTARALGAAQRGYEMVVEHVKARRQFGVPLGSFQAMQHKLANLLINLEGVRLIAEYAADRFDAHSDLWRVSSAMACAFANQALRQTVLETHHAFGAIGYSEEHEMPRHFRRVHGDLARLGGVAPARQAIAQLLLDGASKAMAAFDLGPAANAFRADVRQFLAEHWNTQHRAAQLQIPLADRGWDPEFTRKLAEKGWTRLAWPVDLGGQGRSALEQFAFAEEMGYADAPTSAHMCAVDIIAPAIIAFGSPEQKSSWLPAIARNEISCCLGYSEPEAGSDLSALRTRAERNGDEWIINGQKLWTTTADKASHVWLAVRTDPDATPKHKGISVFLVPLASPGISVRPSMAMYGHTFCTVFYDNVRVSNSSLVGGLNDGWRVITHALASERILMGGRVAILRGIFDDLIEYLRTTRFDGRNLSDDTHVRDRIGQLAAEIEVARHFSFRSVQLVEQGKVPVYEAAVSKVFFGELMERALEAAIEILGTLATLSEESVAAPLQGRIEQALRASIIMVIGGGAAEIQRTLIAQRGIGLPRA
jgi:alkylation response protein AidB-like acyl-CoA dehydrogenase